jgi:segregation and condensation protein B
MINKSAELEALLYLAGDDGLSLADIAEFLNIQQTAARQLAEHLQQQLLQTQACGLQVLQVGDRYKLTTKADMSQIAQKFLQTGASSKLSQAALEVLAIVAYQQPITRAEIDELRGVNSHGALQTLIWRNLVISKGHKAVAGSPRLYQTTDYFLQYFGLDSLADLPAQEQFTEEIEQPAAIDLFQQNNDEPQANKGD